MFKQLRSYFVSGLLILAPFFLTVWVLVYLVRMAGAFVVNPIFQLLPVELDLPSRVFLAKIAIALAVVLFVTALGLAAHKFIFRRLLASAESVILGIPVFSRIYRSFKDIAQAMFGGKSGVFKRVAFFEYPNVGVYTMGFVTGESFWPLSEKTGEEYVTLFVPSPPNPTTGYSVLVPKKRVIDSDMTVEDGIKYCISCGVAVPGKK